MSPDEVEFLEKIRENPADDTVRLVYADWLEETRGGVFEVCEKCRNKKEVPYCSAFMYSCAENGFECDCNTFKLCEACNGAGGRHAPDPRAEFIRLQCELANWQQAADAAPVGKNSLDGSEIRGLCERRVGLEKRQQELLKNYAHKWFDNRLHDLVVINYNDPDPVLVMGQQKPGRPGLLYVTVRRGFPEAVECPGLLWLKYGSVLTADYPITDAVLTSGMMMPVDQEPTHPDVLRFFQKSTGLTDPAPFVHKDGKFTNRLWPGVTFHLPSYNYSAREWPSPWPMAAN